MLGPRFIPGSIFYTQSIMLSPRFIPESVFYTQSVVHSPQSAVRSSIFILTGAIVSNRCAINLWTKINRFEGNKKC